MIVKNLKTNRINFVWSDDREFDMGLACLDEQGWLKYLKSGDDTPWLFDLIFLKEGEYEIIEE